MVKSHRYSCPKILTNKTISLTHQFFGIISKIIKFSVRKLAYQNSDKLILSNFWSAQKYDWNINHLFSTSSVGTLYLRVLLFTRQINEKNLYYTDWKVKLYLISTLHLFFSFLTAWSRCGSDQLKYYFSYFSFGVLLKSNRHSL